MQSESNVRYKIISAFDESKNYNTHITKSYHQILCRLQQKGDVFSPQKFCDKNQDLYVSSKRSKESFRSIVSRTINLGIKIGVLEKCPSYCSPSNEFMNLETISYWQSQLRGSKFKNVSIGAKYTTKSLYLYHLWSFNRWLVKNTFSINQTRHLSEKTFEQVQIKSSFKSVEELINILSNPLSMQSDVIKIIKKYLTDPTHTGKKASSINNAKCAILSYFEKNEFPLIFKFDPKAQYDYEEKIEDQELTLSEFMQMLTTGKPSVIEKAVFLCKFHRGLDASTLVDRFNYEAWEQISKWFGSENHNSWNLEKCPVPVRVVRIKTGYMHAGFLDRDAMEKICTSKK